jgi:hypothetical protein
MFWSKPSSLALAPDSPLRVEEPNYEGIKRIILKLMLFYSKQSKSIRGANVVYRRIISQVDKPLIYEGDSFLSLLFMIRMMSDFIFISFFFSFPSVSFLVAACRGVFNVKFSLFVKLFKMV